MSKANGPAGRIELTDLRAPVLTDIQQGALQAAAAHPMTLTPEAVLQTALAETGLSDFGADDFRPRLAVWLRAIDEDSNASAVTRANLFQMTVRLAATRLRLEDYIKRHPDCLDVPIERPIIVAGLPRSGTTYLLELLSADRRLRSLPWWEATAPIPAPGDEPTQADPNPRYTRSAAGWQGYEAVLPYMKYMHSFSADHISEDIELQALDFSSYLIEWLAHVPRWRDFYLSQDQSGPYAYLRRALQVLTHIRGPARWVIKCPQHMEQLPALYKTFPDAVFVLTHRDPVGSIRSAMTMSLYAARILRQRVDPAEPLGYWPDRYERLLRACVRDRDVLPAAQTLDLYFHDWIGNPEPVLQEIYRLAGLELDAQTLEAMRGVATEGGSANGKLVYNLERDFGISAEALREKFGFYFDRFPVRVGSGVIAAEDERAIVAVLLRYATGIDRRDWPLFRTCFTEDFTGTYPGFGTWHGADAITDFMRTAHENLGLTLHRMSNFVIEGNAGTAAARSYVDAVLTLSTETGKVHRAAGLYDDMLVRGAAGWQIARRAFVPVLIT